MVNATHQSFAADDRSYFSLTKKEIHKLASDSGFPTARLNGIDLIVSELTSNIHKHTVGGGEILAGIASDNRGIYLEIISIDNGPGFKDAEKVIADGFSSSNTLGHGLGSIKRFSDVFDIYSQIGWGTIVLSRVYKDAASAEKTITKNPLMCRGLVVSKPGEKVSGDGYFFQPLVNGFKILVADGLGHGPEANEAVNKAVEAFKSCKELTAADTIRAIHAAIKKTRGIVGNIIIYNALNRSWCACGVGNIATKWIGGLAVKNHLSYNGIIGHNIPNTMNDICLKQEDFQQFIACSDGIRSRWDPAKFPMIGLHDPIILNTAIYKDFARRTDDMSVVICKLISNP